MLNTLKNREVFSRESLKQLFNALNNKARLVGGCVRDTILGNNVSDIDIATPFSPEQVIEKLRSSNIKVVPTGLEFGTVTAIFNDHVYEITTLRKDTSCDGRHAIVEYTDSYEEDAARRDFTINAMSCDIDGNIFDYYGGIKDLKNRIVRFVGDGNLRCKEDYLRILRFFRFFAYYGKKDPHGESLQACLSNISGIDSLSGERMQKEMIKLFQAKNPYNSILLMKDNNVSDYIFGSNNIELTLLNNLLDLEEKYQIILDPILRIAVTIKVGHDNWLASRWKLSNKDKMYLHNLLTIIPAQANEIIAHLNLTRKYGKLLYSGVLKIDWARNKSLKDEYYINLLKAIEEWNIPVFPVHGKDLMNIGFRQGKEVGEILLKLEKLWEDSQYRLTKNDLLSKIHTI